MDTATKLRKKIRNLIFIFIIGLILSGITAFPIESELRFFSSRDLPEAMKIWMGTVYNAVAETNKNYPYLSYGTDWLAFAHLVIAVAFIGPLRDPIKNIWIIEFGMIACVMVFPLAFIAGHVRQIPFYWQLIDCSFGVFAFILLFVCRHYVHRLEKLHGRQS